MSVLDKIFEMVISTLMTLIYLLIANSQCRKYEMLWSTITLEDTSETY